jgi:hypothetical protein
MAESFRNTLWYIDLPHTVFIVESFMDVFAT